MSRRALIIPHRLAASISTNQFICKRCLATQVEPPSTQPIGSISSITTQQSATQSSNVSSPQYDPSLPYSQRPIDPATGKPFPLKPSDRMLKRGLPQRIPQQYLQHSTSDLLPPHEKAQRAETSGHKKIVGVVVSAGKMDKTVKVRIPTQTWNKTIGKYVASHTNHLVHDPNSSLVPGDVVELHRLRVSKEVHHVVASIVAPFGEPVEARPPILTPDERLSNYKAKRFAKLERRSLRREAAKGDADAIRELKSRGLDSGHGVEAGKGEKANLQPSIGRTGRSGRGAVRGEKGQKLPHGVLPGGQHEVGKIDERAKRNKESATRWNEKAEENLLEAREKAEQLREKGVNDDEAAATTVVRGRVD